MCLEEAELQPDEDMDSLHDQIQREGKWMGGTSVRKKREENLKEFRERKRGRLERPPASSPAPSSPLPHLPHC